MLTRTTLRAPRDNSPLTQGTEIRYSAAQNPNNTQGAEVKRRMAGSLGNRTSTRVEGFNVATVSASASARPESYTAEVIDVGPSESESTFVGSLGLGGDSGGPAPAAAKPSTSSGRKSGRKRQKDKLPTTNELVKRDIKRYGNTVPKGSFGSGSKETIKASPGSRVDTNVGRHKPGRAEDQPKTKLFQKTKPKVKGGQGGLPLGTTTRRQGEQPKGPAVNLSNYKDNREKQQKLREAKRKEAKEKAEARKKKTESSKPTGFGGLTSRSSSSRRSGSKSTSRGARGSSSSRSRGGASRGGSRSNSGSKSASRGARGSSSSRSRGGVSRGASRRTNRSRSRRRCDIRCKFDISILTNQNLMRDDLADVAYFVRTLKEINE